MMSVVCLTGGGGGLSNTVMWEGFGVWAVGGGKRGSQQVGTCDTCGGGGELSNTVLWVGGGGIWNLSKKKTINQKQS